MDLKEYIWKNKIGEAFYLTKGEVYGLLNEAIEQCKATSDSTAELQNRIDFIESRFRHIHVNSQDESDVCKQCGLDLRDKIHCRAGNITVELISVKERSV